MIPLDGTATSIPISRRGRARDAAAHGTRPGSLVNVLRWTLP
jgi:hypothetical protein